jgi:hypothetical protein
MEEGTSAALPAEEVGLVVGEPAQFRFFASSLRREDKVGAVVADFDDALEELPPLEATLPAEGAVAGQVVPVRMRAHVTEIGTLTLECVEKSGKAWKLEFKDPDRMTPDEIAEHRREFDVVKKVIKTKQAGE